MLLPPSCSAFHAIDQAVPSAASKRSISSMSALDQGLRMRLDTLHANPEYVIQRMIQDGNGRVCMCAQCELAGGNGYYQSEVR